MYAVVGIVVVIIIAVINSSREVDEARRRIFRSYTVQESNSSEQSSVPVQQLWRAFPRLLRDAEFQSQLEFQS